MVYVSLIFIAPVFALCIYYIALGTFSIILRLQKRNDFLVNRSKNKCTFAIVIPAYNEENTLPTALESCSKLDYPKSMYEIFVIADNCSDKTGDIAKGYGVNVLTRSDKKNRGKGFALTWAFEKILPNEHDAIIILDADCTIDSHALRVFDIHFDNGEKVLQSNDVVSNADESSISYVSAVGNMIENDLFYWPKSKLGLAVFLRGTGMVFAREILETYPWAANSIVEDVEYSINLFRHGINVVFIDNVVVASKFPANVEQLNIQRKRWASGNLSFGKYEAFKLIWQGIKSMDLVLLDAGWTFLTLSRPLAVFTLILALLTSGILHFIYTSYESKLMFVFAIVLGFCLLFYFLLGIVLFGLNKHRLKLLLNTPIVVFKLIVISLLGLTGVEKELWTKTPRL
jgi:cellulose synthase/poly-beta-1,6-N-acetylglucosamine synthase-like glycosyltransferase